MVANGNIQKPIKKSYRTRRAFAALLIIILGLYFFYLNQAYYFSIDHSYIVLRAGLHQFSFLPGFGRVVIQTDFKKEDLAKDRCRDLDQGKLGGLWFLHSKEGYELWGDQLADCLNPVMQAKWLRLLRGPTDNLEILSQSVLSSEDTNEVSVEEFDLEQLARTKPEFFTAEIIQSLMALLTDKNISVRLSAASILRQLAETNPRSFTPESIQSLTALLINQDYIMYSEESIIILGVLAQTKPEVSWSLAALLADKDRDVRYRAAFALEQLAKNAPASFRAEMVSSLFALHSDKDNGVRSIAVSALGQIALTRPELFTPEMIPSLARLLADEEYHVRAGAASALGGLAQTRPEFFTPEIVQSLTTLLADRESFVRSSTALALGQLAVTRPEYFTPKTVGTLMNLLTDGGSFVPCSAAFGLSKLAQTKPELFTSEIVQSIITHLTDEDPGVRSNVTSALEELAQRRPRVFTPGVVQKLMALLANEDPVAQFGAASVLGTLAKQKPESIQRLFLLLKNDLASNERIGASKALFVAAVKDTRQKDLIEDELKQLIKSPKPVLRTAASQTLEMIAIGDSLQQAHAHPDQLELIRAKLNELKGLDGSLYEEHLQFAAEFALGEIEKIKSENK
jgi:HEAT repeat protein